MSGTDGPVGPGGPDGPDQTDEADEARTLLAAYALDAVDDLERRSVERLVATDPEAARELADLRETAAALGAAAAARPPPDLRAAVLADVARTPQEPARAARATTPAPAATGAPRAATDPDAAGPTGPPAVPGPRATGRHRPAWSLVALAASVALLVGIPATLAWQQNERAAEAERQVATLTELLAEPGTDVLREEVVGGGAAVALLGTEAAVILVDGLAPVGPDQVYQLWAMRDGVPVPAGLLELEGDEGRAVALDYRAGDGLAVSVEPAGGSEQPTTTPVVVLLPG